MWNLRHLCKKDAFLRISCRNVRTVSDFDRKPPWWLYRRRKGWSERGPHYRQHWEWPERESGWHVIPMWFPGKPELVWQDDAKSQHTGYPDPVTNKYVTVDDAKPEIIVPPNMDECKFKPYVSFRTPESEADAPPLTAKDLFDIFYADRVETDFKSGKYAAANTDSFFEKEIGDDNTRRDVMQKRGLPVLDDGSM